MDGLIYYVGYDTHKIDEAVQKYIKKMGETPTLILCRPEFEVVGESDILLRSRTAGANMLMVTHQIGASEYVEIKDMNRQFGKSTSDYNPPRINKTDDCKNKVGRPAGTTAMCPHCCGTIKSFEHLGFWYGWAIGIQPPYWEALRAYVFVRDDFTCYNCHKKFTPSHLTAHHIQPKEEGGTDSARNLATLCSDCHLDTKPIFDDGAK